MSSLHPTSQYLHDFSEIIYSSLNSERVLLNTKERNPNQTKTNLDNGVEGKTGPFYGCKIKLDKLRPSFFLRDIDKWLCPDPSLYLLLALCSEYMVLSQLIF